MDTLARQIEEAREVAQVAGKCSWLLPVKKVTVCGKRIVRDGDDYCAQHSKLNYMFRDLFS